VPQSLASRVHDLPVEVEPLDHGDVRSSAKAFLDLSSAVGADRAVHLYADAALPHLLTLPAPQARLALLLFRPRAHYPSLYGSPLSHRELLRAHAHELLVRLWRRGRNAGAVLTLDEGAAQRWRRGAGAAAHWLPEPPLESDVGALRAGERRGCILFGAIAPRKGVDLLAAAVAHRGLSLRLTLAGLVEPAYRPELEHHVGRMRSAGADVEVFDRRLTESEALQRLAGSACAVLPYPRHYGMSRVLFEAAAAGTPVLVHGWGLLGFLVRRHRLGVAVDCADARAFADALDSLARPEASAAYADSLRRFAARFSPERFRLALEAGIAAGP
jgi:hypothetical protein